MGCNCKTQDNFNGLVKRYGDGVSIDDTKNRKILWKIINFLLKMVAAVLSSVLFIVMAIPTIIYVMICILFGRNPVIRMPWLNHQKKLSKRIGVVNGGK